MARVLVVEDDTIFGTMLRAALENWGHESVRVRDGQEAFREVAGHAEEYDLILCDLQMPRMPGRLFLQQAEGLIRDEIPVIVLSADRSLIEALGTVRDWVFDAVEKGLELEALHRLVERALEKRRTFLSARDEQNRIMRLERRNEFLLRQAQAMYEQSRIDPMTGLPTRRRLEEEFASFLATGGPFGGTFVLALCDMDDFRRMNKEWGYEGGDKGIARCAGLMREAMRSGDLLFRYGGDEFVLLVKAQSTSEGAQAAERLREHVALAPGCVVGDLRLPPITFSAGLAFSAGLSHPTLSRLLHQATKALRQAKENGGNGIWPHEEEGGAEEATTRRPDAGDQGEGDSSIASCA